MLFMVSESFCSFFEWDGWLVPSRLSYSVYLVHMNFIHVLLGIRTQLSLVSFYNMLIVYFGVVVMSVMLALPFYLIMEAPMTGLLKMFLKSKELIQREVELNEKQKEIELNEKKRE
ncbi:unnamed protein product [Parnassius apollo]|uniref:(apollo) hypothetical protein n=1 Tax=Parnassius apollo TaxID=110799 RepID=A0A8S3XGY7_PARAO|nr:unnamed protein product [Parnassius apollo]